MFHLEDVKQLLQVGHELGCHTFGHCHSWDTPPDFYKRSILENQYTLQKLVPGTSFQTFAYPHSWPQLGVKKVASALFKCCRAGGRKPINIGTADLNLLSAVFLEQTRDNPRAVKALIDKNALAGGWLIFATHDVSADPSPFGCTPDFFEQVVRWSVESGSQILPVVRALTVLQGSLS
jgi:peptidoglycan/xylan/chitin deacetylase (PgdA/CDA1 family)